MTDDYPNAKEIMVDILSEKAKNEGCKYCRTGCDLECPNSIEPSIFVRGNELVALRYDEPDSEVMINYCPMCGHKLTAGVT